MAFRSALRTAEIRYALCTPASTPSRTATAANLRHAISWKRAIHVFRNVPELRLHRRQLLLSGEDVGLVPTMGALHKGHLSLMRHAAEENQKVFVTIFVNPTQFGENEDLDSYPKTWDSDLAMLEELDQELEKEGKGRIDTVFAPTTKIMYPTLPPDSSITGKGSFVTITPLGTLLEGKSRPVFFRGVATVCMKLFSIVNAERVYFGQKDVQQSVIIKRLVKDFHLDTQVRIVPTEREPDGLALSSRNAYLGERRRKAGIVLSRALRAAESVFLSGKLNSQDILGAAMAVTDSVANEQSRLEATQRAAFMVDYISLADPDTLEDVEEVDPTKGAVLSGAIWMLPLEATTDGEKLGLEGDKNQVRLIDNIIFEPTA